MVEVLSGELRIGKELNMFQELLKEWYYTGFFVGTLSFACFYLMIWSFVMRTLERMGLFRFWYGLEDPVCDLDMDRSLGGYGDPNDNPFMPNGAPHTANRSAEHPTEDDETASSREDASETSSSVETDNPRGTRCGMDVAKVIEGGKPSVQWNKTLCWEETMAMVSLSVAQAASRTVESSNTRLLIAVVAIMMIVGPLSRW